MTIALHAKFLEGRRFSGVVYAYLEPLQIIQGRNGPARVDTVRFNGEGRDYDKVLIPPESVRRDHPRVGETGFPLVAKQSGQLDDRIVRKLIRGIAGHDKGDIRDPVAHQLRLLCRRLAERAAKENLDLQETFRLGIDGVDERFHSAAIEIGVVRREERQFQLDRLGGPRRGRQQRECEQQATRKVFEHELATMKTKVVRSPAY